MAVAWAQAAATMPSPPGQRKAPAALLRSAVLEVVPYDEDSSLTSSSTRLMEVSSVSKVTSIIPLPAPAPRTPPLLPLAAFTLLWWMGYASTGQRPGGRGSRVAATCPVHRVRRLCRLYERLAGAAYVEVHSALSHQTPCTRALAAASPPCNGHASTSAVMVGNGFGRVSVACANTRSTFDGRTDGRTALTHRHTSSTSPLRLLTYMPLIPVDTLPVMDLSPLLSSGSLAHNRVTFACGCRPFSVPSCRPHLLPDLG